MKSSIIMFGHPHPEEVDFGADHFSNLKPTLSALRKNLYAVLVCNTNATENAFELVQAAKSANGDLQTILVGNKMSPSSLQKLINQLGVFKIIPTFDKDLLQVSVHEALEEYELIKQNETFVALTKEQNARLQQLMNLLEEKVKARENYLIEARKTLVDVTKRSEALNKALVTIQKSVTKSAMENQLNESLKEALNISWLKIVLQSEDQVEFLLLKDQDAHVLSVPLIQHGIMLGHIYFARPRLKPFDHDEDDFLLQISDAVALAIDRLLKLEAAENLKQEWDSTFDSITAPVSLVSQDYRILRANEAFAAKTQLPLEKISGLHCYAVLFGRERPCPNCKLGENFELGDVSTQDQGHAFYSVNSHFVDLVGATKTFAMIYRDTSHEHRFQRQILEASKMAELGTIGSSIAHEINNPLGGIIAFLQIIKSEVDENSPLKKDVLTMESAAVRCKSIVENLLAFTRQASADKKPIRIGDIFRMAINLVELQTRAIGIKLEKQIEDPDVTIQADNNQIVQVLVNVIQNSCESLAEKLSHGKRKGFIPTIKISCRTISPDKLSIEITDVGTGIKDEDLPRVFNPFFTTKDKSKNPGLGLSVSYQIVKEHSGEMEVSSVFGKSTTVTIILPPSLRQVR